jgi:very-short-patch-repair endonuclease
MNYRIDFNETEQELFGRPYVVLDLYWPKHHCGIEYDGEEDHSSKEDVSRDRKKSSELNYRGINVVRVDKQQLSSPFQVYVLARKLQRLMKIRHRKPTDAEWQRKEELFDILMR